VGRQVRVPEAQCAAPGSAAESDSKVDPASVPEATPALG